MIWTRSVAGVQSRALTVLSVSNIFVVHSSHEKRIFFDKIIPEIDVDPIANRVTDHDLVKGGRFNKKVFFQKLSLNCAQILDLQRRDIALEHYVCLVTILLRLFWDGGERRIRDIVVVVCEYEGLSSSILQGMIVRVKGLLKMTQVSVSWHSRRSKTTWFTICTSTSTPSWQILSFCNESVEHKHPTARKTIRDVMDSWTLLDSLLTTTRLTDVQVGSGRGKGWTTTSYGIQ